VLSSCFCGFDMADMTETETTSGLPGGTEEQAIKDFFDSFDTDGSETIDVKEAQAAILQFDPKASSNVGKLFVEYHDSNGDGEVGFDEFLAGILADEETLNAKEEAESTMEMFDQDGDKKLTFEEVAKTLGVVDEDRSKEIEAEFLKADTNQDKFVSLDELEAAIQAEMDAHASEHEDADEGAHHDKDIPDDVKAVDDKIVDEVVMEEITQTKGDRLLLSRPKLSQFYRKFQAQQSVSHQALHSWAAPIAGGLTVIPLLVAAFACRRRLRFPARVEYEDVAEE